MVKSCVERAISMKNVKISVLMGKLALVVALVVLIATSVWKLLGVPIG